MRLKHRVGKTGMEVSTLGLGGHTFAARYGGMDRALNRTSAAASWETRL